MPGVLHVKYFTVYYVYKELWYQLECNFTIKHVFNFGGSWN